MLENILKPLLPNTTIIRLNVSSILCCNPTITTPQVLFNSNKTDLDAAIGRASHISLLTNRSFSDMFVDMYYDYLE